ncbi:hypothetical protein EVAR_78400_1 [Eumeta japonica]|uniref:Uncharacterized protein n=1 Tax=Eumeta variegata TaxID=151549 RepID=A0A4C1T3I9_EUMVA|nr:hypothetical protein EVAR_78400_1 [Eumeta japonica]
MKSLAFRGKERESCKAFSWREAQRAAARPMLLGLSRLTRIELDSCARIDRCAVRYRPRRRPRPRTGPAVPPLSSMGILAIVPAIWPGPDKGYLVRVNNGRHARGPRASTALLMLNSV